MVDIFQLKPNACVLTSGKPAKNTLSCIFISVIFLLFKPHGFVAVLRSKEEGCVQAGVKQMLNRLSQRSTVNSEGLICVCFLYYTQQWGTIAQLLSPSGDLGIVLV